MFLPNDYRLPDAGSQHRWFHTPSIAIAKAALELAEKGQRVLLVAANGNESQQYQASLALFKSPAQTTTVVTLPDRETLPYDHFSTHPDILSERLGALYKIQSLPASGIAITSVASLLTRVCPRRHINQNSFLLKTGEQLDVARCREQLTRIGYQHRETVYEHGEFAVRGSVIDLFPMGGDRPYRIELFDTEVESLRSFDVETQRSLESLNAISILPAGEVRLDAKGINLFRNQWHNEFSQDPDICPVYTDTVAGLSSAGIEAWLPMFYEHTETLFDYLPEQCAIFASSELQTAARQFIGEVAQRFEQHAIDPTRPLLKPEKLYLAEDELFALLKPFSRINHSAETDNASGDAVVTTIARGEFNFGIQSAPQLLIDDHADDPLQPVKQFVDTGDTQHRLVLCVESPGRREVLLEKLGHAGIEAISMNNWLDIETQAAPVVVAVNAILSGAHFPQQQLSIVSEAELFGVARKPRTRNRSDSEQLVEATINSLVELREGSPVVHIDHGIGLYRGLETMDAPASDGQSITSEFLMLEYAGGDKLYVPVTSLHLISRYMGGDESAARLNRLGNETWANTRKKAVANIHDVAAELLAIYAKRKLMQGFAHTLNLQDYQRFCEQFPFEETDDQQTAIDAVALDMQSERAMDRLVCGDVGFGKTEVAIRAAFIAANNSKQVMMLVPTTLLAQQHYQNFVDRFADWPIAIDTLSRFRTASEQKKVLASFASGQVDVLIGTHKLIQQSVKANDLGLVIVDEEHRFGVKQKDQLKKLCANVDLLTMTATPIPRTLNMAMAGLRDLSIIATPPARRLSVKTFVHEKQNSLIKEAILRELLRGGQVFYLHNDIDSIEKTKEDLQNLIPEARIAVGHGQMPERDLEQVMADFYHKKFNILLCTTIIETGIDIPNANTIIIERADKFGLAQLHQLRGRVGRSHHQAYAYLFIPNRKALSKDAEKRLDAIEEAQDLGAGFMLATHDLEIRGAGELLGSEQSGQIHTIGFSLYLDMLERAVEALKNGEEINLAEPVAPQGEINLHLPAIIPDSYLPDIHNRLTLYKRIAAAKSDAELRELKVEMIDRFGLLTDEINNLFELMKIKLAALPIGVAKIELGPAGGYIEFSSNTAIDPMKIVTLVQRQPQQFALRSATRLGITLPLPEPAQRIRWLHALIEELTGVTQKSQA